MANLLMFCVCRVLFLPQERGRAAFVCAVCMFQHVQSYHWSLISATQAFYDMHWRFTSGQDMLLQGLVVGYQGEKVCVLWKRKFPSKLLTNLS